MNNSIAAYNAGMKAARSMLQVGHKFEGSLLIADALGYKRFEQEWEYALHGASTVIGEFRAVFTNAEGVITGLELDTRR
ncbi:hypothetical protein [Gellertiella hungarica]|uniref:Uncharacterized protein n=1 Tax=Gellertiella hungarica TaxID=1572859 RepID=A0A7W6JAB2_9HYPH|nr:hypothetical protein [Gellertiella hungarica]MBB4066767.1 hypothetical protein [Gellertiella hungarica]